MAEEGGRTRDPARRVSAWRAPVLGSGALVIVVAALLLAGCGRGEQPPPPPADRGVLSSRNLETPTFQRPPRVHGASRALANLWEDVRGPAGRRFLRDLLPNQGGVLWIALLVALAVAFDFRRWRSARNLELMALLAIGVLLFDVMRFFPVLEDPTYFRVLDWVFTAIVAVSLTLLGIALWRMRRPHAQVWRPNLPLGGLVTVALLLLALNVAIGLLLPPDDSGWLSNVGGQRLRESGMFPYGDPLFSGTPIATYTPVFYLLHVPFQLLFDPAPINAATYVRADFEAGVPYYLPSMVASQLATAVFHVIGVAALVVSVRRLAGAEVAWGLAALYCGSAYVMGVGGSPETINGMTFISHIVPPAVTLIAFACLGRPILSGFFLATGVATLFYPMFFIPAWLGYYWPDRRAAVGFVGGMALATLLIGVPVLLRSQPAEGRTLIGTILYDTAGHQQDPAAYGSSPFGFWGARIGIRERLRDPVVPGQYNTSPMFLIYAVFVLAAFFLARGRTPVQLALLTAALAIGAQMWKIHGTGVYVTWYYPFLLIGLFAGGRVAAVREAATKERLAA